jgi:hypothetical protein
MFSVVLMLMCLVITLGAFVVSVDALAKGQTTLRLRGGGRIALDGWVAYAHAINGLIFGASTLCFTVVFGVAGLGPQRWGRVVFPLLGFGAVLFTVAAVGAAGLTVATFIRSL